MRKNLSYRCANGLLAAALLLNLHAAKAQLPSFSGAEGFGGTFAGSAPAGGWFSNATVYHVTTTQDLLDGAGKPVQGTLRGAFYDYANPSSPKQQASNRIVVFDVGGVFDISANSLDIKTVNNIYIAGQTAPSPVTVYGNTTQITKSSNTMTSNVILRYMTFRKGTGGGEDAITFAGGSGVGDTIATNMILDHVSASWSEDEDLSVTNNNTNVTVQYSIIADSLTSGHAYGSLIRPQVDSNVTYQHNLYANNVSRQPRPGTYNASTLTFDFRNNVVYNWRDRAGYSGGSSEAEQEYVDMNYVGNYMVAGSGTISNTSGTFIIDKNVDMVAYNKGNYVDSDRAVNPGGIPNGAVRGANMIQLNSTVTDQTLVQVATPFTAASVTTQSAPDAFTQTINYVGNSWWSREPIDARIMANVQNNTGPPNGIGAAAPDASELAALLATPVTTRAAGWDIDNDGMPDSWEIAHNLNPNLATDSKLDFDGDGYVNLQEYLDEIGAFPAPTPLTYVGASGGPTARYALITNWKTSEFVTDDVPAVVYPGSNWQPSRFDEAQVNGGTVVVDAVGQHARSLKIAANPGNNATLNVTSGWLRVEQDLQIAGPGAAATLNLTGGELSTNSLSKGSGGAFNFTGGTLHAGTVNFDLVNNGGVLSPGQSIGQTHVVGDLSLASGALHIELASALLADTLLVDGTVTLGGSLDIATLGGFLPTNGDSWQIISAASITGQFSSITSGYSVQKQGSNLVLYFGSPALAGDYNGDGIVDSADYVVWRKSLSTGATLLNETASPGVVDQADYDAWRSNFGATSASGSAVELKSVPEPGAAAIGVCGIGLLLGVCSRRRWQ